MKLNLTDDQFWLLVGACDIAKEKFGEHAQNMRLAEEALNNGQSIPLFAPGKEGADSARRLANQFVHQQGEVQELKDTLLEEYEVREGDEE